MLRRTLLSLIVLAGASPAAETTEIQLFTMGPGDALFSKFGHAALCVVDAELPAGGLCYNYGTTDFSRPVGLGWDVVRGRAKFWVSVTDLMTMLMDFQAQDRTIYRQVLPLSPEQAESLRVELARDAEPENREYIYSHFLDNCSTRPRDLIDGVTDGRLRRETGASPKSYRDFAREGFAAFNWGLVPAGDLILGRWVDQPIERYHAMFIPRELRAAVQDRFDAEVDVVYVREAPLAPADVRGAQRRSWLAVLAVVALAFAFRLGAVFGAGLIALLGLFVWAGALLSPWPELRFNELLVVLMPTDVLLFRRPPMRAYLLGRVALLALAGALALSGVFVQPIALYWVLAFGVTGAVAWRQRGDILAR